jgi:hypothetical protein
MHFIIKDIVTSEEKQLDCIINADYIIDVEVHRKKYNNMMSFTGEKKVDEYLQVIINLPGKPRVLKGIEAEKFLKWYSRKLKGAPSFKAKLPKKERFREQVHDTG